ncbi:hypothetical protein T12_7975 [Trichinella patagoniensis]|uniref:Uncharacterized protein n=1 Tax=Trichinella patagoniensis TaxID=990121 RepID=A0A0V1ABZ8_9BILA|nr:hypothetical protein T12_7975 [Trichinella patagoniensis]
MLAEELMPTSKRVANQEHDHNGNQHERCAIFAHLATIVDVVEPSELAPQGARMAQRSDNAYADNAQQDERVLSDFRRDHMHGSGVENVRPAGRGLDLCPAGHVEQKREPNCTVKNHFHLLTGAPTLGDERIADAEKTVRAHH